MRWQDRLLYSAGTAASVGAGALILGFGPESAVVAGLGGIVGAYFSPELQEWLGGKAIDGLPAPESASRTRWQKLSWLLAGEPAVEESGEPVPADVSALPYEEYLRTPHWHATRQRILTRDRRTCQDCGATQGQLDVHHLTYERLGRESDEDLLTLCHSCHDKRHGTAKDEPMEALQPLVRRPQPDPPSARVTRQLPRRSPAFAEMKHLITPGQDILGYDGEQFTTAESFKTVVNFALIGVPGSGKTVALSFHAAQAIMRGAIVRGWDLHGDVAADLGDALHILEDVDEIVEDCGWIQEERERRMALRKRAKAKDNGAMIEWDRTRELFYIVDEFNALMLRLKSRKDDRALVADTLLSLIAEGRKFKMRVIITGQTMPAALFGDQGSSARDIINTKYALRSRENHAQYFGIEPRAIDSLLPRISGEESRGYAILDGGPLMHAILVSIPHTTAEDIRMLLDEYAQGESDDDDVLSYIVSRKQATREEIPPAPPTRSMRQRQTQSSYDLHLHRQRLAARRQPVYAREAVSEAQDADLARGVQVYQSGSRTIDAFQAAMGIETQHQARKLLANVKATIMKKEES